MSDYRNDPEWFARAPGAPSRLHLHLARFALVVASLLLAGTASAGQFDDVTPDLLGRAKVAVKELVRGDRLDYRTLCATYKDDMPKGPRLPGGSQKQACQLKDDFRKVVLMINRNPDNEGEPAERAKYSKDALEWELKNLESMGKLGMRVVPQDVEVFQVKQFVNGVGGGQTAKNVWAYIRADVDFSEFEEFHWLTQLNVSRPEAGPPPLSRLLERYTLTQRAQEQYCADLSRYREALDVFVVLDVQGALNVGTGEIYWMDPYGSWRFMPEGQGLTPQTLMASRFSAAEWQPFPASVGEHPFFKDVLRFRNQGMNSVTRLYTRDCLNYPDSNWGDNTTRQRFNMGELPAKGSTQPGAYRGW